MSVAATVVELVAGRGVAAEYRGWEGNADRYWHRSSAALASLGWALALGWPTRLQLLAVAAGLVFGGGRWSPDVDQYKGWSRVEGWRPVRWLSRRTGSPLRHHGITHSVPIAAAVTAAVAWLAPGSWWLIPLQWVHHDLGDVLIGRGGDHVDAGPSWGLWRRNWGLGVFKSGGFVCMAATFGCWLVTGWLLYWGVVS